jgi:DNA segregation ATPase FtsK/SpoIIIE-like protein
MNLKISMGKSLSDGKDVFLDLQKDNIHTIVISGMTGSGKSTFHHSVTKQLMKKNSPDEVGFVFMDFKRIEFGEYKDSDYLFHPIVYDPEKAVEVFKELVHESDKRFKGVVSPQKAIVVHIEECDIVYHSPGLLDEVWKVIDEQSQRNNMYMFFSSSRPSADVFSELLLDHSSLRGCFVPGGNGYKFYDDEMNAYTSWILGHSLRTLPKPWTRIFKFSNGNEIECKGCA